MNGEHLPPETNPDDRAQDSVREGFSTEDPELPAVAPAPPPEAAKPVAPDERINSVDVLRGFALLGILAMNIVAMGWPFVGYEDPRLSGGDDLGNRIAWSVNSLIFSGKMMSLFSMLFGAGLVLMGERAEKRGAKIKGVYYRRVLWLLLFGIIHAHFIWFGDILFFYALCGMILFLFRRLSPAALITTGTVVLVIMSIVGLAFMLFATYAKQVSEKIENAPRSQQASPFEKVIHKTYQEGFKEFFEPDRAKMDIELNIYRSGYGQILMHRIPFVAKFQIAGFFVLMLWMVGARMLIGMGLMKLGVFSAERSWRFYAITALAAYGIGMPATIYGMAAVLQNDFESVKVPIAFTLFFSAMLPVALGHAAVVMMICKSGLFTWLTYPFAAVGRMALTNYLMHSLIGTTLFYGYGFGYFGHLNRIGMWGIVLAIWLLQLVLSPIWLKFFRYGPAEWAWRSLTYWRLEPMRYGK